METEEKISSALWEEVTSAISCGNTEVLERLLKEHPRLRAGFGENGYGILHYACMRESSLKSLKWLMELDDLDVNMRSITGEDTPLIVACLHGNTPRVKVLLGHPKVNANLANSEGTTPLVLACWAGDQEMAEAILKGSQTTLDMGLATKDDPKKNPRAAIKEQLKLYGEFPKRVKVWNLILDLLESHGAGSGAGKEIESEEKSAKTEEAEEETGASDEPQKSGEDIELILPEDDPTDALASQVADVDLTLKE